MESHFALPYSKDNKPDFIYFFKSFNTGQRTIAYKVLKNKLFWNAFQIPKMEPIHFEEIDNPIYSTAL